MARPEIVRLPVADIVVHDRSRKLLRNIESLARSITDRGLLHPIPVREVDGAFVMVCGQRRVEAAKSLGWSEIPVHVLGSDVDELEALYAEGDENTEREPFTATEAVEHRRRIREVESKAAKARQREGQARGRATQRGESARPKKSSTGGEPDSGKFAETKPTAQQRSEAETRHRTAKATGYSSRTLDKAEEVVDAADDEEQPEPVRTAARAAVTNLGSPGAKVDREYKRFKDEQAKSNPDVAAANFRKALTQQLVKAGELTAYDVDRVIEVCDESLLKTVDDTCEQIAAWHEQIKKKRARGLRVVGGES